MIYYIIFCYLFMIGVKLEDETVPNWNILFAPIIIPIVLGKWVAHKF